MRVSPVQQALQIALALVCVGTATYYATGVDWTHAYMSRSLLGATFVYCFACILALAPYVLLWHFVGISLPEWLKLLAFGLVVAPAPILFFVIWWHDTDGFSFFLVPVVQFFIVLVLLLLAARLKQHTQRGVPT